MKRADFALTLCVRKETILASLMTALIYGAAGTFEALGL